MWMPLPRRNKLVQLLKPLDKVYYSREIFHERLVAKGLSVAGNQKGLVPIYYLNNQFAFR